jgi:hypothetical protein
MTTNDKPPVFRSWTGWYITVILFLAAQVILFALITEHFR